MELAVGKVGVAIVRVAEGADVTTDEAETDKSTEEIKVAGAVLATARGRIAGVATVGVAVGANVADVAVAAVATDKVAGTDGATTGTTAWLVVVETD